MNSSKKIIIYSSVKLFKGNTAASSRIMNYARAMSKKNEVYLCSFITRKKIKLSNVSEVEPNIFLVGKESNEPNKHNIFIHIFNTYKFLINIYQFALQLGNCRIFLLYPSKQITLDILTILYLIKFKGEKVYLEVNELRRFSSGFLNEIRFSKTPLKFIQKQLRKHLYLLNEKLTKNFNGLICISTNIEQYCYRYNDNIIRIPILTEPPSNNIQKKFAITNNKFLIGFTGSVNIIKENLDLFLYSLANLKRTYSNFEFHLFGPITLENKKQLDYIIEKRGLLNNVYYLGYLDQKQLFKKLLNYNLLILPRGNNLQNKFGFSTKLAEYLASGVPVLATNVSDNAYYIKDRFNGFLIEPDSYEIMTNKLIEIINEYNHIATKISINAIETVNSYFDYMIYEKKLNDFLC